MKRTLGLFEVGNLAECREEDIGQIVDERQGLETRLYKEELLVERVGPDETAAEESEEGREVGASKLDDC